MDLLDPTEARVVGCLIEKALTTPDQYPMTLNALTAACNQRSNRDPVMDLDDESVFGALDRLRGRGWVTMVMPSGGRVERWRRLMRDRLGLDGLQEALMAELLLRGPQTAGELRARVARMKPVESIEAMNNALDSLSRPSPDGSRPEPLVRRTGQSPGERAERWAQTLAGASGGAAADDVSGVAAGAIDTRMLDADARMNIVETRLSAVEDAVRSIRREISTAPA